MRLNSIWSFGILLPLMLSVSACSYHSPGIKAEGTDAGGTGGIRYQHEDLGNSKHLITVTASPGFMETEGSIRERINIYTKKFAAKACPKRFSFVDDPNLSGNYASGFAKRSQTFVFVCN